MTNKPYESDIEAQYQKAQILTITQFLLDKGLIEKKEFLTFWRMVLLVEKLMLSNDYEYLSLLDKEKNIIPNDNSLKQFGLSWKN